MIVLILMATGIPFDHFRTALAYFHAPRVLPAVLAWEEFPLAQKFFAVGETVAHLDYLRLRGKVVHETVKGKNRYRAV